MLGSLSHLSRIFFRRPCTYDSRTCLLGEKEKEMPERAGSVVATGKEERRSNGFPCMKREEEKEEARNPPCQRGGDKVSLFLSFFFGMQGVTRCC